MSSDAVDPFANLNLDGFKKEKPSQKSVSLSKEEIKQVAQESNFQSRQVNIETPKQKYTPKTFSMFPDDNEIIQKAIRLYMNHSEINQASGSDVVRAALHVFSTLNERDQVEFIEKHRGRARK